MSDRTTAVRAARRNGSPAAAALVTAAAAAAITGAPAVSPVVADVRPLSALFDIDGRPTQTARTVSVAAGGTVKDKRMHWDTVRATLRDALNAVDVLERADRHAKDTAPKALFSDNANPDQIGVAEIIGAACSPYAKLARADRAGKVTDRCKGFAR